MNSVRLQIRVVKFMMVGLMLNAAAYAQKVGSTSMQFLKVMPGARGAGAGEAYTVWATGAEAIFWNPAGLARLERMSLTTTYVNWLFDSQQGAVAYAQTIPRVGVLGLQIQYVDFGEFEETTNQRPYISNPDAPGFTGRTFNPFSCVLGVAYARDLTDKFSLGLGLKYAYESLFNGHQVRAMVRSGRLEEVETWASVLLFDLGMRYNTGYRTIHIGSAVQNFGADVKYARESHPVPLMFRFGIGADVIGPDALLFSTSQLSRLRVACDIFHPNDYGQQFHTGMEYEFAGSFALRAGYKFNYDFDGLTLGAGFQYSLDGVRLAVDYSYGDMGTYLGYVQRISIGIGLP